MLRAVVAVLLLANLAFFAWARGWLDPALPPPRASEREPQRLAAQVRPESVTVLPAKEAGAAVIAARAAAAVCVEAGPLSDGEIAAAEAALAPAQLPEGSWARQPAAAPPPWLVFAGRWPDATARGARVEELRRLKLDFELIETPADLAPGLVLSRHADRAAADAALAVVSKAHPALKNLRVAQLPAVPPRWWLRVAKADIDVQTRLQALPAAPLAGGFKACAAPGG
jgi:hypothetical protein